MANFKIAYERTAYFEGGYVHNTNDAGGETYYGISRVHNPTWKGWAIVDAQKKKPNFPANLKEVRAVLKPMELTLYKTQYWDRFWGDKIRIQIVANEMYDSVVNLGVGKTIQLKKLIFGLPVNTTMDETLLNKLNSLK